MDIRDFVVNEKDAALIWCSITEGQDTTAVQLIKQSGSYMQALEMLLGYIDNESLNDEENKQENNILLEHVSHKITTSVKRWIHRLNVPYLSDIRTNMERYHLDFICWHDDIWPEKLNRLGDEMPLGLWIKGNKKLLEKSAVSIVGSRDCSEYGKRITADFSYELSQKGHVIVSGGAHGIDTYAHSYAFSKTQALTIVVFAGGLGKYYPAKNTTMFDKILRSGGLFVSESPPLSPPLKHRFLSRNRIISALSDVTVVVEAPFRSGAISTGHHTLSIGGMLAVIPGSIFSPHSSGCHRLLRDGGVCVTSVSDVEELLPEHTLFDVDSRKDARFTQNVQSVFDMLPEIEKRVYDCLSPTYHRSLVDVAQRGGMEPEEVWRSLSNLMGKGLVQHERGEWILV
ncbi:MAG: DNA-processing protein DprA [Actinomycetaceae bacterium]|nr:DNA-processing protein DprA [Actinomycetaceae bacterium]